MAGMLAWLGKTVDSICDRPDHLQRLAIAGAGTAMYPMVWGLIMIVWKGFGEHADGHKQQIAILGWALYLSMLVWTIVVAAMLGTIKGVKLDGPGGVGVEVTTTADDPDVDPSTTRDTRLGGGRRHRDDDDSGGDDATADNSSSDDDNKTPAQVTP